MEDPWRRIIGGCGPLQGAAINNFLRTDVPRNWSTFCDTVSDNFRVISRSNFRVLN
jgi:hypothetical protein